MSELLGCPFCGRPGAICQLEDEPGSAASFWVNCSCGVETRERRTEQEAVALWNTRAPAQGEPVAWRYRWSAPVDALWETVASQDMLPTNRSGWEIEPLYAVSPSSPTPVNSSLNYGESDLQVTADFGVGEAIFEECAEIALEHIGQCYPSISEFPQNNLRREAYDEACKDIADAIRTRASNRKIMDALADAAQGEKK
jgi:Lar family restriction alleviation protein